MRHTAVQAILGIADPIEAVAIDIDTEGCATGVKAGAAASHEHRVEPLVVIGRVDPAVLRGHYPYPIQRRIAIVQRVVAEGQHLAGREARHSLHNYRAARCLLEQRRAHFVAFELRTSSRRIVGQASPADVDAVAQRVDHVLQRRLVATLKAI